MSLLADVALVVAGAFLADLAALLAPGLARSRRVALHAAGAVGLALVLLGVPGGAPPASLACGGYALVAGLVTLWAVAPLKVRALRPLAGAYLGAMAVIGLVLAWAA